MNHQNPIIISRLNDAKQNLFFSKIPKVVECRIPNFDDTKTNQIHRPLNWILFCNHLGDLYLSYFGDSKTNRKLRMRAIDWFLIHQNLININRLNDYKTNENSGVFNIPKMVDYRTPFDKRTCRDGHKSNHDLM